MFGYKEVSTYNIWNFDMKIYLINKIIIIELNCCNFFL